MAVLLSASVAAIGVTPGRTTINFEPNARQTLGFDIINDQQKDVRVILTIDGDAKGAEVILKQQIIELKSTEDRKHVEYDLRMPKEFESPGTKELRISITEMPDETSDRPITVGAMVGVITQVRIKVPEQGKYLKIEGIEVSEGQAGEYVTFLVPVNNLGTERIGKVKANITIFGPTNEEIAVVETQEEPLDAMKRTMLKAVWPANVNAGKYFAVAYVSYDEKTARAEKIFTVGRASIEILGIDTKNFQLGGIAKMDVKLKSNWNEMLEIFAELFIKNTEMDQIANVKTPTAYLEPGKDMTLTAYWDTQGVEEGKYYVTLRVNYGEKEYIEKQFEAFLSLNGMSISPLGMTGKVTAAGSSNKGLMVALIVILIVINVGWFWYMKKRK
ncbi:MAG: hypothetical protein PHO02_07180 [Candidatus Nanoarchaeia archaeon]|nr:hypothetical protein [Candidatus Nanoarchaeia archaeon]